MWCALRVGSSRPPSVVVIYKAIHRENHPIIRNDADGLDILGDDRPIIFTIIQCPMINYLERNGLHNLNNSFVKQVLMPEIPIYSHVDETLIETAETAIFEARWLRPSWNEQCKHGKYPLDSFQAKISSFSSYFLSSGAYSWDIEPQIIFKFSFWKKNLVLQFLYLNFSNLSIQVPKSPLTYLWVRIMDCCNPSVGIRPQSTVGGNSTAGFEFYFSHPKLMTNIIRSSWQSKGGRSVCRESAPSVRSR